MRGSRPWWLPTAVFVLPACAAAFAAVVVLDSRFQPVPQSGLLAFLITLALPVVVIVDLARREDRFRDGQRAPGTSRWGEGVNPRDIAIDALVTFALLVWFLGGALLGYGVTVVIGRDSGGDILLGLWTLGVVLSIAAAAPFIKRWRRWEGGIDLLRWIGQLAGRWPTTVGAIGVLIAGSGVITAARNLLTGPGWPSTLVGVWGVAIVIWVASSFFRRPGARR